MAGPTLPIRNLEFLQLSAKAIFLTKQHKVKQDKAPARLVLILKIQETESKIASKIRAFELEIAKKSTQIRIRSQTHRLSK